MSGEVEIPAASINVAQQPSVEEARISGAGYLVTLAPAGYDAGQQQTGGGFLSQRGVSPSLAVVVLLRFRFSTGWPFLLLVVFNYMLFNYMNVGVFGTRIWPRVRVFGTNFAVWSLGVWYRKTPTDHRLLWEKGAIQGQGRGPEGCHPTS